MKRRYFAHAPGMVYAVNVYAESGSEARALLREFLGVNRLPPGSAVWEADDEDIRIVGENR